MLKKTGLYIAIHILISCNLNTTSTSEVNAEFIHKNPIKMHTQNIPYTNIDWSTIPKEAHQGETGTAYWQTLQFEGLRIRMIEYTPGYVADHWCEKGHIVYCIEGTFISELKDGTQYTLSKGMSYVVSDDLSSHRSSTKDGVTLLIIDGAFLKANTQ